ncbi:MAG: isochorismatase family protein, partial [Gammaproteobacteria bacterium]|nr:isochorismatase family protein [Gammaproteobacteria bacterium]
MESVPTPLFSLCRRESSALLIVDVQIRLAAAMPAEARARVLRNSGILIEAASQLDIPILQTEQYPRGLGHTEPVLAERLQGKAQLLEKTAFSCCDATGFDAAACADPQRTQWILCGMEAHVCVLQTALELHARGLEVFVVEDAVCSRSAANHTNAMARLRQAGVIISNTESV